MFFTFAYVLIDTGMQHLNAEIRRWLDKNKVKKERKARLEGLKDETVVRRRVTNY